MDNQDCVWIILFLWGNVSFTWRDENNFDHNT